MICFWVFNSKHPTLQSIKILKGIYYNIIIQFSVMRKTQPKDVILALRPLHVVVTDYPALKT